MSITGVPHQEPVFDVKPTIYFAPQVERRLREVAKRDAGKGVILRHLNMANRMSGVAGGIKGVFMNAVVKSTSKLLTSEQWVGLDLATVLQVSREICLYENYVLPSLPRSLTLLLPCRCSTRSS